MELDKNFILLAYSLLLLNALAMPYSLTGADDVMSRGLVASILFCP